MNKMEQQERFFSFLAELHDILEKYSIPESEEVEEVYTPFVDEMENIIAPELHKWHKSKEYSPMEIGCSCCERLLVKPSPVFIAKFAPPTRVKRTAR